MTIRAMRLEDAPAVATLSGELGHPASATELRGRMAALLDDPDHRLLVVESEGEVLGWVHVAVRICSTRRRTRELVALVVANTHRGKGLGEALLAEAETWAVERALEKVSLRSREDRRDAHRFYERLGYRKESLSFNISCALPRPR